MLIHANWSVALYCQRCGKIEIHDVSYFTKQESVKTLRCSCNHPQATLIRTASNQIKLQIPCGGCNSLHEANYKAKNLLKLKLEKIYCSKDFFELGYIGKREEIEEILAFTKREFERIIHSEEQIEKQQIFFEVINKLHDIAEQGGIICPCESKAIEANLLGDSVILECLHCGSYCTVSAKDEDDLEKVRDLEYIELAQGRILVKNIDLD
ncbi:MAG: hypothetical protein H6Q70_3395 [Firmicutes bacterium]|nr:hypothetical protein [Bacillota bacterium]